MTDEKKCPNNPLPHLLQAQKALALLRSKLVGRPSTGSFPSTIASPDHPRKSRKENPQKLTQLSSRSHPRHLVGKMTAQKDTIKFTQDHNITQPTLRWYWFWRRRWRDRFLYQRYLLNQLMEFHQTCLDISLGHA